MKQSLLLAVLLVGACREDRPAAPTAEESQQLNEAEDMLSAMAEEKGANDKGPEDRSPGPSNQLN